MNIEVSVCTWSDYDDDGFLGIQADTFDGGMTPFHHIGPLGLHARPVDPTGDNEIGALCLSWTSAHEGWVFPLGDVRTEHALPNLAKGATMLHDTGVFGGPAFVSTVLLDPEAKVVEIEGHRPGVKIRLKNAEGLIFEIDGETVKIGGAAQSIELGDGATPLALASLVDAQFAALKAAIASAATTEKGASGMGGMSALQGFISAWPAATACSVAKGV